LKIGYESTRLSRGEACKNTRKTRLSIKTERYLVVYLIQDKKVAMNVIVRIIRVPSFTKE
jgi:hypothetical protein